MTQKTEKQVKDSEKKEDIKDFIQRAIAVDAAQGTIQKRGRDPILQAVAEAGYSGKDIEEVLKASNFTAEGLKKEYGLKQKGIEGVAALIRKDQESVRELVNYLCNMDFDISNQREKANRISNEYLNNLGRIGRKRMSVLNELADEVCVESKIKSMQGEVREKIEAFIEKSMDPLFKTAGQRIAENKAKAGEVAKKNSSRYS